MSRAAARRLRLAGFLAHRLAVLAYLAFALFPLFWLLKISVTPDPAALQRGRAAVAVGDDGRQLQLRAAATAGSRAISCNSVLVSVPTALTVTLAATGAGYALSRFRFRGKSAVRFFLLLTQMFPLVMLIAPIYRLMTPLGLANSLVGLVVVYTAFNVPFATFLMQSFFDGIPVELEEAAMIDGCTRFAGAAARHRAAHPARASAPRSASSSPPPGASCCSR